MVLYRLYLPLTVLRRFEYVGFRTPSLFFFSESFESCSYRYRLYDCQKVDIVWFWFDWFVVVDVLRDVLLNPFRLCTYSKLSRSCPLFFFFFVVFFDLIWFEVQENDDEVKMSLTIDEIVLDEWMWTICVDRDSKVLNLVRSKSEWVVKLFQENSETIIHDLGPRRLTNHLKLKPIHDEEQEPRRLIKRLQTTPLTTK